jgi:hypothetical protein
MVTGSEELLLLDTRLVIGCNRTAICDVVCSGKAIDFRICGAESLRLATEDVREMLFCSDGEFSFAAAVYDIVGAAERAKE